MHVTFWLISSASAIETIQPIFAIYFTPEKLYAHIPISAIFLLFIHNDFIGGDCIVCGKYASGSPYRACCPTVIKPKGFKSACPRILLQSKHLFHVSANFMFWGNSSTIMLCSES